MKISANSFLNKHNISFAAFCIITCCIFFAGSFRFISNVFNIGSLPSYLFLLLLVVTLVMLIMPRLLYGRIPQVLLPEAVIYFLWILWAFAGLHSMADSGALARNIGLSYMSFIVGMLLVHKSGSDYLISVSLALMGLLLIFLFFLSGGISISSEMSDSRLGEEIGNANEMAYALFIAFIGSLRLVLFSQKNKMLTLFWIFLTIFLFVSLILTGSRKAFLGAIFVIFWSVFFVYRFRLSSSSLIGVSTFAILISGLFFSNALSDAFLWSRFGETESIESLIIREQERLSHYFQLIDVVLSKPITGVGLGGWEHISFVGKASHSEYVSIFGETGILGGFLYFSLLVLPALRLLSDYSRPTITSRGSLQTKQKKKIFFLGILLALSLIAFGRWNYTTPIHFLLLGGITAFSKFRIQ